MTKIDGSIPYDYTKRVLDLVVALLAIVITLPIQVIIGALVAVRFGRPILFKQPRPGKGDVVFTLLKFRSMEPIDLAGGVTTDEQRLTTFGRLLRSSSLDELPSLFNVVAGHMSIVGPRPLHVRYLDRYSAEQRRRHNVRPGMTGLAQINGRNSLDWSSRLKMDVTYVDNRSLLLDLRIALRTFTLVLSRKGISQDGHATVEEFMGSELPKDAS